MLALRAIISDNVVKQAKRWGSGKGGIWDSRNSFDAQTSKSFTFSLYTGGLFINIEICKFHSDEIFCLAKALRCLLLFDIILDGFIPICTVVDWFTIAQFLSLSLFSCFFLSLILVKVRSPSSKTSDERDANSITNTTNVIGDSRKLDEIRQFHNNDWTWTELVKWPSPLCSPQTHYLRWKKVFFFFLSFSTSRKIKIARKSCIWFISFSLLINFFSLL